MSSNAFQWQEGIIAYEHISHPSYKNIPNLCASRMLLFRDNLTSELTPKTSKYI
jgi:hypothetical protein